MKHKKYPIDHPVYPKGEDIYNKYKEETEIDPEDTSRLKLDIEDESDSTKALDFKKYHSGDDLDVPGSELDDDREDIGAEDEENNYYSTSGDNNDDFTEEDYDDNDLGARLIDEDDYEDNNLGEEDLGEGDLEEEDMRY